MNSIKDYLVADDTFKRIFTQEWQERVTTKNIKPTELPKAYVLGGQPAAGKSKSIARLKEQYFGDNVLVVNGDEFRELHPQKAQIDRLFGERSVDYTAQFAGKMTQAMIQKAIDESMNLIIEGTFRTAQTPIDTLTKLKNAGYQTGVVISTADAQISWQSALDRYQEMLDAGLSARYTPKYNHDITVDRLGMNADTVLLSRLADSFVVNNRQAEIWNTNHSTMPSVAINQELNRSSLSVLHSSLWQELTQSYETINKQDIDNTQKERKYEEVRQALLQKSIQHQVDNLSTHCIIQNYPTISNQDIQKIEHYKNHILQKYEDPKIQQAILEKIHSQLPDVASGKITLPNPSELNNGKGGR